MTSPPFLDSGHSGVAHTASDEAAPVDNGGVPTVPSNAHSDTETTGLPDLHPGNGQASFLRDRDPQNPQVGLMPNSPFHRGLPPEIQSLLAGVLAAVGAPPPGFPAHLSAGHATTRPGGNNENQPTGPDVDQPNASQSSATGTPAGAEDFSTYFRQQFAQFAEALRQSSTSRADPERAEELLRGLQDPGQTVLRRLVRICEVEDARGESNEGVQCGICLDTITEIFERASPQDDPHSSPDEAGSRTTKEVDATSNPTDGSTNEPVDAIEKLEMQDVEMLVDGQQAMNKSEKTTFKAFPCHHLFCAECLLPWLSTHTTCPTCRLDIDPHSVTLRRPMNRQRRTTTIRPANSRSAGERNPRIAGTPSAWRFLRAPSRSRENPETDSLSATGVSPSDQPHRSDTPRHNTTNSASSPVPDTTWNESDSSRQISTGSQHRATASNEDTRTGAQPTGPTGNMTIVFLTGNPPGPPPPSGIGLNGSSPVPPIVPAGPANAAADWGSEHNAGGPMFLTIDVVPDPPTGPSDVINTEGVNPSTPNQAIGGQTTESPTGRPELPPRERMAPPTLFAFPPNFLGIPNPFSPPEDTTYTRSPATWTPPAPNNSLEQWLLKRERELNIVCDDPHCKYICPDIISNFDDALTDVRAFGSHDQVCEHKHHMTCLIEGNQSTGWYRTLNPEAKQAALRCLHCRNHGWIDVPAV